MSKNGSNGTSKRSSIDNSDAPPNQRSRTGEPSASDNPSGASTNSPPPKTFTLAAGQAYRFESWNIGTFMIRGGSSGGFDVFGSEVRIFDTNGTTLFSEGGYNDRVTFEDNLDNGTTTVTFICGSGSPPQQNGGSIISGEGTVTVNLGGVPVTISSKGGCITVNSGGASAAIGNGNGTAAIAVGGVAIKVTKRGGTTTISSGGTSVTVTSSSTGTTENQPPLKIKAFPNERIELRGSRNFLIDGNGAILQQNGCGNATVNGDLRSVTQTSTGNLTVYGNVSENIVQVGVGNVDVRGRVGGELRQTGCGNIKIGDTVQGNVTQFGVGELHIGGDVNGDISQMGIGSIIIDGTCNGNNKTAFGFGRLIIRNQ